MNCAARIFVYTTLVTNMRRAKENAALQLEVALASQTTRLADLELAGKQAVTVAAAAHAREKDLTRRVLELEGQLASAEDVAARQSADAVAAALEGVSQQIASAEVGML